MILLLNKENWLALYIAIIYSSDISPEQSIELVTESTHIQSKKKKKGVIVMRDDAKFILNAKKTQHRIQDMFDSYATGDSVNITFTLRDSNKFRLRSKSMTGMVIYAGRYLSVRGDDGVVITVNYSDVLEKKMKVSKCDLNLSGTKNLGARSEEKVKVEY